MYKFILTEGDVRDILAKLERRRYATDRPQCLQVRIEVGNGGIMEAEATLETLSAAVLQEMREKGQLSFDK